MGLFKQVIQAGPAFASSDICRFIYLLIFKKWFTSLVVDILKEDLPSSVRERLIPKMKQILMNSEHNNFLTGTGFNLHH